MGGAGRKSPACLLHCHLLQNGHQSQQSPVEVTGHSFLVRTCSSVCGEHMRKEKPEARGGGEEGKKALGSHISTDHLGAWTCPCFLPNPQGTSGRSCERGQDKRSVHTWALKPIVRILETVWSPAQRSCCPSATARNLTVVSKSWPTPGTHTSDPLSSL